MQSGSGLTQERPESVVSSNTMQLSGTSFAAPVVAGAAAMILAAHPDWTPDQLKGALMASAQPTPAAAPRSLGVGELDVAAARALRSAPNPNAGLDRYVTTDASGSPVLDTAAWQSAALASVAWGDIAWGDTAWSDGAWASVAWDDVAWGDAAWGDVAWGDGASADDAKESPLGLPATLMTNGQIGKVEQQLGIVDANCDPTAGACS